MGPQDNRPSAPVASDPMAPGLGQNRQGSRDRRVALEWTGLALWKEVVVQTPEGVSPSVAQELEDTRPVEDHLRLLSAKQTGS